MQPRLTAGLRVAALLRRCDLAGRAAYVIHRGDDTAGAIALSVVRPSGRVELWSQEYDFDSDQRPWVMQAEGAPREIDASVTRPQTTMSAPSRKAAAILSKSSQVRAARPMPP